MVKGQKGKPSGVDKNEGLGARRSMPPEKFESDEEMTEKYTDDADELKDSVPVRHPNRNVDKGESPGPPYS